MVARPRPYLRDGVWRDDVWGFRCNGDCFPFEIGAEIIRAESEAREAEARALFYSAIMDQIGDC